MGPVCNTDRGLFDEIVGRSGCCICTIHTNENGILCILKGEADGINPRINCFYDVDRCDFERY
jgi:hypothetical protein